MNPGKDRIMTTRWAVVRYYMGDSVGVIVDIIENFNAASDLIWRESDMPDDVVVWFIADKGIFWERMDSWLRNWIWDQFEIAWESSHNYVFRNDGFQE